MKPFFVQLVETTSQAMTFEKYGNADERGRGEGNGERKGSLIGNGKM